jgi:hypothetical protein
VKRAFVLCAAFFCCAVASFSATADKPQQRVDLATVVTKADAEAVLGEPVNEPQARNAEESDGYYSRCNYYGQNDNKCLVLRVHQVMNGKLDAKAEFKMISSSGSKLKSLDNIGDQARVYTSGPQNGLSRVLMLYVAKGNSLITVALGGLDDENVAMEKAKSLAKKILKQL